MKEQKKDRLGLSGANYLLMLAALIILTLGYIIMGQNEISISPILLIVAYVIVIPVSLLIKFKNKD
jgi:membrane protein YdbS with pleckstrin-like domain